MPRFFNKQTKRALWKRAGQGDGIARCEILFGWGCGAMLFPGHYVYDHIVRYELTQDSTLENGQLLCDACNNKKTFVCDLPDSAKGKRMSDRHIDAREAPRRPMPCGRHSRRSRTMSGKIVERLTLAQKLVRAGILQIEMVEVQPGETP